MAFRGTVPRARWLCDDRTIYASGPPMTAAEGRSLVARV